MEIREYDKLRKKISVKDFEGNNKTLDKWLFGFSFVGNIGSIFFSYFLLYPALLKAISINVVSGTLGVALTLIFSITFLSIFEIIKRYLFRNFSSDYVVNNRKINGPVAAWLSVSVAIVLLSFYLSLVGSKNLASTSTTQNSIATTQIDTRTDSLSLQYERKKKTYEIDNQELRSVNNDLRNTLAQTPLAYVTARQGYQQSIDKNGKIIESNQAEINRIEAQLAKRVNELNLELNSTFANNATEDKKNIALFIIIAIFAEVMVIGGVYFREWYEYNLYILNQQKFEKIYQKKDRYRALLAFVYKDGKLIPGDQVMPGQQLKEIVADKATIQNSNKFVDDFLKDMDNLGIFSTVGKRRSVTSTYAEAQNIIEHYDDAFRALENMK